MILTGALVLFGAGTAPQVVTALAMCVVWFGLIANFRPFCDSVDDRLAQAEALQVLFTILIGLVLQLEQGAQDTSTTMDKNNLGVVLIVLNCAVLLLALVQQPLVRIIAIRIARVPRRIREKIRTRREWEPVWIVTPSAEAYQSSLRALENADADEHVMLDTWCDTASNPPRALKAVPRALSETKVGDAKGWMFDGDGNVLKDPREVIDTKDEMKRWFDLDTMRVLKAPPTQLFETTDCQHAVQWLDAETQKLLRAHPGILITQKPHTNDDRVRLALLRHRHSGVLKMVQMSEQQHTGADDADPDAVVLHLAGVRARQHVNPLHRATIEGTGSEIRPLRNIVEVAEPNGAEPLEPERAQEPPARLGIAGGDELWKKNHQISLLIFQK